MEASEKQLRLEKSNWQVITVTLGLLLTPFIWLALYTQPFADDFAYIRKVIDRGYWGAIAFDYQTWNGRFFSNFLVLANPFQIGNWAYKLTAVLLIVCALGTFWTVLSKLIEKKPQQRLLLTFLLTLTYFALMPTLAEGVFWYTGAVTYHLGNLLLLLSVHWISQTKTRIIGFLSLFISLGFNEVQTALIVGFAGLSLLGSKWRIIALPKRSIALLIGGLLLMLLSPGNGGRSSNFADNLDFYNSVKMASLQTFRFAGTWMITPFFWVYLLVLIVLPFQLRPHLKTWLSQKPGWWFIKASLVGIFVCTFLPYYGTGILGQHRTLITAEFLFIIWSGLLVFKYKDRILAKIPWMTWAINPLPVMILFGLIIAGNGFHAVYDLVTGNASQYDIECQLRLNQATASPGADLVFQPLTVQPNSLFELDLTPDTTHWINANYSIVNGVHSVVVVGDN